MNQATRKQEDNAVEPMLYMALRGDAGGQLLRSGPGRVLVAPVLGEHGH